MSSQAIDLGYINFEINYFLYILKLKLIIKNCYIQKKKLNNYNGFHHITNRVVFLIV
jgi:hypothetical protein